MLPEQLHTEKRSFVKIHDHDLRTLVLDLRAKEYEIRSQFSAAHIISKLASKRPGTKFQLPNHRLEVGGFINFDQER